MGGKEQATLLLQDTLHNQRKLHMRLHVLLVLSIVPLAPLISLVLLSLSH